VVEVHADESKCFFSKMDIYVYQDKIYQSHVRWLNSTRYFSHNYFLEFLFHSSIAVMAVAEERLFSLLFDSTLQKSSPWI
jgi:hypothetical protein